MKTLVVAFILALLLSSTVDALFVNSVMANPAGTSFPALAMPVEYINYTITSVNGSLWAKIDGTYPISLLDAPCGFNGELPMVYPMPPQTTNIKVWLDDKELSWMNYTEVYPDVLHQTAIGDWWMIHSVLSPVPDSFVLKIHYEHPLQMMNGSYLFLYDLNISPYLSEESSSSTAYFTFRMETNSTNLQAYTAKPESGWNLGEWQPISYTAVKEDSAEVISVQMHSSYYEELPGDLVIVFGVQPISEFPLWILPTLFVLALLVALTVAVVFVRRKAVFSRCQLSKSSNQDNTLVVIHSVFYLG